MAQAAVMMFSSSQVAHAVQAIRYLPGGDHREAIFRWAKEMQDFTVATTTGGDLHIIWQRIRITVPIGQWLCRVDSGMLVLSQAVFNQFYLADCAYEVEKDPA